uniref:Exonuclease domain-containing protein n=1 Tax=Oryza rufipogon TaxID=4529 RepID=A0A0E0NEL6_ORYRU
MKTMSTCLRLRSVGPKPPMLAQLKSTEGHQLSGVPRQRFLPKPTSASVAPCPCVRFRVCRCRPPTADRRCAPSPREEESVIEQFQQGRGLNLLVQLVNLRVGVGKKFGAWIKLAEREIWEMSELANKFLVLHLDGEGGGADDTEEALIQTSSSIKEADAGENALSDTLVLNYDEGSLVSSSGDYQMPLVWIDLEMTGLDVAKDRILEIACIITDGKLTKQIEGPDLVINQKKDMLDNMDEWCKTHHAASGLTQRVLQSTISEHDAETQVLDFVKKHVGSSPPLIAGNSVYVDLLFLKNYMPQLAAIFSHVIVDVSSIMALCIRWYPKERKRTPQKGKKHRAMNDIKESIAELKYYKDNIFKPQKSKQ